MIIAVVSQRGELAKGVGENVTFQKVLSFRASLAYERRPV
jgi:hypothetical protein